MNNQISQIPNDPGTFGLDFNYAVWTAGTHVLLANVTWNSDYRDVVKFPTQSSLDAYLEDGGLTYAFDGLSYAPVNRPIRVNLPFNVVAKFNYLRARNTAQPVPGGDVTRSFYYFITDIEYVAPNTTQIVVQLDVWQSFEREVKLGNCYVERGHIGIANENQWNNNGRDYLTVPEGLDVGSEYMVRRTDKHVIANVRNPGGTRPAPGVVIASTVSFQDSGGDVNDPKLNTARGSMFQGLPNGASLYYVDSPGDLASVMIDIGQMPWISQGIISIYAIPALSNAEKSQGTSVTVGSRTVTDISNVELDPTTIINLTPNFRGYIPLGRYSRLQKFLTFPYTMVEVTTYSGNPIVLKPELMNGSAIELRMLRHLSLPNPRIAIYPYKYNTQGQIDETVSGKYYSDNAEFLDITTGIFDLPTFSVVNNSYMAFLASNRNSIAYQHQSADWSQQRALEGARVAEGQAGAAISASQMSNQAEIGAAYATNHLTNQTAAMQYGVGAVGMAGSGNPGALMGVATSGAQALIAQNQRNEQLGINTGLSRRQNQIANNAAMYNRDTNKQYADWAAQGDYMNAIAGINARVQDARMVQPTTSGQLGGDAFNLTTYEWAVHAKVKSVNPGVMAMIGEFWLRYGYAIHRFITPPEDYRCMSLFTYWKLRETYIRSATCPEGYKQTLRGIFEKGVTVWSNPEDIGMVDMANNSPLGGIAY